MSEEHIAPEIDTTETESQQDLNSQIQEITNKYLRSLADTENLKKRNEKNMQDTRNFALVSFAKELLVVLDIFDKAFSGLTVEGISKKTQTTSKVSNSTDKAHNALSPSSLFE